MDEVESDIGTRFAHLLQPIRDLTKNWDIDVASQLEEYLSQVKEINLIPKVLNLGMRMRN